MCLSGTRFHLASTREVLFITVEVDIETLDRLLGKFLPAPVLSSEIGRGFSVMSSECGNEILSVSITGLLSNVVYGQFALGDDGAGLRHSTLTYVFHHRHAICIFKMSLQRARAGMKLSGERFQPEKMPA